MNAGLRTVAAIVLTVIATTCAAQDAGVGTEYVLQPAGDESLRSVPGAPTFESMWEGTAGAAPILQASLTQPSSSEEDSELVESAVLVESVTAAVDSPAVENPAADTTADVAADVADSEPFIDLQNPTSEPAPSMAAAGSETNELFVRLAVWTIIILCLCVLTMLGLRRWQRRQGILPEGAGQSRVLETLAIGPGRAVSLVQLGDVRAVIGTDGSGIKTIVLAPPAFDEELSQFDDEPTDAAEDQAA